MNLQNLLDQFMGVSPSGTGPAPSGATGIWDAMETLTGNIPGGVVGGAAAGGIMALLMSNKSARKFVGKAATYGGAALLGGLAYEAYRSWQAGSSVPAAAAVEKRSATAVEARDSTGEKVFTPDYQLMLIEAMIAAAKANGHIDAAEQQAISSAVERLELSTQLKGLVFDLLQHPIAVNELAAGADSIEQKSEIYLASCLAIDPDHPSEQAHLEQLAQVLALPDGLAEQLQRQVRMN
jgi:uncharacterized membrane protein YebE (DUF533 family)